MAQVTHNISDSDKVRSLLSVSKNAISLAKRLKCESPHPIYHAAKQSSDFSFKKKELSISVDALYRELTGTMPFAQPVQSRLDQLKEAYDAAMDDEAGTSSQKSGLRKVEALVSDVWGLLNIAQGDFSKADDVSGFAYLSGTICFIVLILQQRHPDFEIEIEGFPASKKEIAKRGERDLDQAMKAVTLPDHAIRIAVTRIALCQKRMAMNGYAKADLTAAMPDTEQRKMLLSQLMELIELPLPQAAAMLNAVKVASNLRKKKECQQAALALIEHDNRFSDPDYKGWTTLASPGDDPDLEYYRDYIAPSLLRGDYQ